MLEQFFGHDSSLNNSEKRIKMVILAILPCFSFRQRKKKTQLEIWKELLNSYQGIINYRNGIENL